MKFRQKPVVVEAWLLTPENLAEIAARTGGYIRETIFGNPGLQMPVLEEWRFCMPGDWIVRGVNGRHHPCISEVFEATYERVEDEK